MNEKRNFRPRALGEIAIRCVDMDAMVTFYEDVIGLERLSGGHRDAITFFRISDGFGGHTAVLALFQHSSARLTSPTSEPDVVPAPGPASSLHHFALSLPFAEQDAAMQWYDKIGQPYRIEHFGWIGWRGIFTQDPEGNTVELVAYDAAMLDTPEA